MRAQDLLKMYAERQALTRPRCVPDDASYAEFERGFIYAAMVFAGAVEALNLMRQRRRRAQG